MRVFDKLSEINCINKCGNLTLYGYDVCEECLNVELDSR